MYLFKYNQSHLSIKNTDFTILRCVIFFIADMQYHLGLIAYENIVDKWSVNDYDEIAIRRNWASVF